MHDANSKFYVNFMINFGSLSQLKSENPNILAPNKLTPWYGLMIGHKIDWRWE